MVQVRSRGASFLVNLMSDVLKVIFDSMPMLLLYISFSLTILYL